MIGGSLRLGMDDELSLLTRDFGLHIVTIRGSATVLNHSLGSIFESQQCSRRVDVPYLASVFAEPNAAPTDYLFDFPDEKSGNVKVVESRINQQPTAFRHVFLSRGCRPRDTERN